VAVAHVSQDGHATASADRYRLIGVPWPAFDDRVEAARGAVRRATAKRQKHEATLWRQPSTPADAERLEAARKKEAARRRTLERAVVDGKVGVPTPLRRAWLAVLRRERPQVIHVHDQAGLATAFAGRRSATTVVYDAHEHTLGKDHKPSWSRRLRRPTSASTCWTATATATSPCPTSSSSAPGRAAGGGPVLRSGRGRAR
jgi:hypothetical protein